MIEIIIQKETEGGRLDKLLLINLDKAPKGFVYKMLRKKNIVLNDKKASGNEILKKGDSVKLYFSDETYNKFHSNKSKENECLHMTYSLSKEMILYEDENIIAINKPKGILSQKAKSLDISLNDMLIGYLLATNETDDFIPGISNRLDRNTSGIVLTGKNPASTRELNRLIKERLLTKIYSCLVYGVFTEEKLYDAYLKKDKGSNKVTVSKVSLGDDYKKITTRYIPVSTNGKISLLNVDLITGKSHQIRAHLNSIDHPIIGDNKYGNTTINAYFKQKYNIRSQMLHAGKITFNDASGILKYLNSKSITAPYPDDFKKVIEGERLCQHGTAEA